MNDVKKIIYNCHQATLLIEKKQLASLTLREKFELKLHLTGCSVCKLFQRQSVLINRQVQQLFKQKSMADQKLDDRFKKQMQDHIEEKLK
jgi:hypothetical protein